MKTKNDRLLAELEPARDALEAWRRIRKHRQPIPAEVWKQVVPLAHAHGVNPVASALRLNYHALRRQVGAPSSTRSGPPAFVEVRPQKDLNPQLWCEAELTDAIGRKMTLRFARSQEMNALALVQAFWKGRR